MPAKEPVKEPAKEQRKDLESIRLEEYTTPSPYHVKEDDGVQKILKIMNEREIRHLPVLSSQGEAIGIISDRDVGFVKSFGYKADIKARDLMTADPVSVNFNISLLDAAFEMATRKIGSLIVNDDYGELYGIFTNTDALNALIEVLRGDVYGERDQIQDY